MVSSFSYGKGQRNEQSKIPYCKFHAIPYKHKLHQKITLYSCSSFCCVYFFIASNFPFYIYILFLENYRYYRLALFQNFILHKKNEKKWTENDNKKKFLLKKEPRPWPCQFLHETVIVDVLKYEIVQVIADSQKWIIV